jgi:hypothetical protein
MKKHWKRRISCGKISYIKCKEAFPLREVPLFFVSIGEKTCERKIRRGYYG